MLSFEGSVGLVEIFVRGKCDGSKRVNILQEFRIEFMILSSESFSLIDHEYCKEGTIQNLLPRAREAE